MFFCTLINYVSASYEHLVTQQLLCVSGTAMDTNELPYQLLKIHPFADNESCTGRN